MSRRSRSSAPLRVAQLCATTDGGLWMVQIALGLQRRGFDLVAIIGGDDGGTAAALRKVGIPYVVHDQRIWRHSRLAAGLGRLPVVGRLRYAVDGAHFAVSVLRMAWLLRRLRVDVVHSHIFSSSLIGRVAARIARVPIVVSMVAGPLQVESPSLRKLDLWSQRLDDRVLAGCEYTAARYREVGVPETRLCTVPYGIDATGFDPAEADGARVRRELGIDDDTVVVGKVAWFYPVLDGPTAPPGMRGRGIKGHEDLLAAAKLVLEHRPDVRFLIVGDGFGPGGEEHYRAIRRLAVELGVDHACIWAGRRADLVDVIASFDISVHASISENYGGTIESLLMERPMVATRAGGMPEVVIDGETGLLVPVQDPPALAAGILRLVEDPTLARRLGQAGRVRMVERHTIQRTIEGVIAVYGEVAAEKGLLDRAPFDGSRTAGDAAPLGTLGLMPRDVLFAESA